jgi:hypothetical protein
MYIKFSVKSYPSLFENMVAKVYESESPSAEVGSFVLVERNGAGVPTPGGGHQVPVTVTFNGLDRQTHILRLYTASAVLLHQYDQNPTEESISFFDPIYFRVGDGGTYTPAAGQQSMTNPAFAGLAAEDLSIFQPGFAFLHPIDDYTILGSTLNLVNTLFDNGQPWRIFRKPVATAIIHDSVVGKGFGGFVDVSASVNYVPAHLRKLIRLSGNVAYTFDNSALLPVGYIHKFTNFGIESGLPQIQFFNANLLWGATPKAYLNLPFGSTAAFTWDGTNWNCIENDIKVSAVTVPISGDVIFAGSYTLGDVQALDNIFTVNHGLNITFPYRVRSFLKGTQATWRFDNNCWHVYFNPTANSFRFSVQEASDGIQNLTYEYELVKI